EILKEKFGVTYKEAKEVLQNSNNDLIEALIYLEERYPIKECCSVKSYILDFKKRLLELYVCSFNTKPLISINFKS
ncbi:Ubiquitin-associated-domain-containing protein, partial [Candidatus Arthromitus sp. SFB-2]